MANRQEAPTQGIASKLAGFPERYGGDLIAKQVMRNAIEGVYQQYGFLPLETPTLIPQDLIRGDYGEEASKLMYSFKDHGGRDVVMRYDLTVGGAAWAAREWDNHAIRKPLKRYEYGPVFRADSPGAGRFRQFDQFDADVFGAKTPVVDAEILRIAADAMHSLNIPVTIQVNDRLLLNALLQKADVHDPEVGYAVLTEIDKLDKSSSAGVLKKLRDMQLGDDKVEKISQFLSIKESFEETVQQMRNFFEGNLDATAALNNMEQITRMLKTENLVDTVVEFNPTIVRGLSYYTGMIFETKLKQNPGLGSIMSGGRYDNMAGRVYKQMHPGKNADISAVGMSVGVDRLVSYLIDTKETAEIATSTQPKVEMVGLGMEMAPYMFQIAGALRKQNIPVLLHHDPGKSLKSQVKDADTRGMQYAVIVHPDDVARGVIVVKNLSTGTQSEIPLDEAETIAEEMGKIRSLQAAGLSKAAFARADDGHTAGQVERDYGLSLTNLLTGENHKNGTGQIQTHGETAEIAVDKQQQLLEELTEITHGKLVHHSMAILDGNVILFDEPELTRQEAREQVVEKILQVNGVASRPIHVLDIVKETQDFVAARQAFFDTILKRSAGIAFIGRGGLMVEKMLPGYLLPAELPKVTLESKRTFIEGKYDHVEMTIPENEPEFQFDDARDIILVIDDLVASGDTALEAVHVLKAKYGEHVKVVLLTPAIVYPNSKIGNTRLFETDGFDAVFAATVIKGAHLPRPPINTFSTLVAPGDVRDEVRQRLANKYAVGHESQFIEALYQAADKLSQAAVEEKVAKQTTLFSLRAS